MSAVRSVALRGGETVPALGQGTWYMGEQAAKRKQEIAALRLGIELGMTLIDTADVYCLDDSELGHNERLVAAALASWRGRREHVIVATKGGFTRPHGRWERNGRPAHLREACERSLRALGVDRINLYQLHAPDPAVPFEDSVGALADLAREGKIRWVGLSNVTVAQLRAAESITAIQTVQNRLNPFFREAISSGVVAHCARQGIGFLAYSPTGGGRLNLKLPSHPVLSRMATRLGASAHAIVLAWLLTKSPTVIPIPSARRVEHALDSVSAADLQLSEDDLRAIDAAEFSRA